MSRLLDAVELAEAYEAVRFKGVDPSTWSRRELVAFVKDVLGEVPKATDRFGMVRIYGDTRALELQFNVAQHIVGTFLVPLPPAVLALANDRERNPYDNLAASVRASLAEPTPPAVEAPQDPPA